MIEEKSYKDWSFRFHADHAKKPIAVQIELTYRCPIHCVHCYTDCYNNAKDVGRELSTKNVKRLMDKLYDSGCLWLNLTGGDPMAREDFLQLYDYAKDKGFMLSMMTSLVATTDDILNTLIKKPPFSIEMTLNGATKDTYEKISQVKGSFEKVMVNIDRVLKAGLPLKIKTLVSKNNIHEIDGIKDFLKTRGMSFSPSTNIFARLNKDIAPCQYRLSVDEVIRFNFPQGACEIDPEDYNKSPGVHPSTLYKCPIGRWQWYADPYGFLNICSCVRQPNYDILNGDINEGMRFLTDHVRNEKIPDDSECKSCKIWYLCRSCPGKAGLENKDARMIRVSYFCELAKRRSTLRHLTNQ